MYKFKFNKKNLILIIVFALVAFALHYYIYSVALNRINPKDLILNDKWSIAAYKETFEGRIHEPRDIKYIESVIVKRDNIEGAKDPYYYTFKKDIDKEEITKVKKILYQNGYYGDLASVGREVETYQKDFLNGKLGQFFRFKFIGDIIWISLPLLVYLLLFKFKKINRWHLAVLFVTLAGYAATYKHGYNYRYQLTLMPILLSFVLIGIYKVLKLDKKLIAKYLLFGTLIMMSLINVYMGFVFKLKQPEEISEAVKNQDVDAVESIFADYQDAVGFIEKLELDEGKKFLVHNLTFFHYYTDKPGVIFWILGDYYYDPNGLVYGFMGTKTNEEFNEFIINELDGQYIISRKDYNKLNSKFEQYLNDYTEEIYDNGSIVIYSTKS